MDTYEGGVAQLSPMLVSREPRLQWERVPVRRPSGDEASDGPAEPGGWRSLGESGYGPTASARRSITARGRVPAGVASPELRDDRSRQREPGLLIVGDCTLDRENLVAVFTANGFPPPSVAWDLTSLFTSLRENPPELVLVHLDTRDSAMLLQATVEISPTTKVIVLGMSEDDEDGIVACAEAGVSGYHLRSESLDDLLVLMRRVADGEASCSPRISAILLRRLSSLATRRQPESKELVLTPREAQILRMLELGLSNRDIASQLSIAVHTVKNHVHSVLTKLGVSTRAEAAARVRTVRFTEYQPEN